MSNQPVSLARLGWHIFPAPLSGGKTSHIAGLRDGGPRWGATNDPDTVARNWQQFPDANIGVACGESGLFVIDIDTPEGHGRDGFQWLNSVSLPHTVTAVSPSGSMHFYFRQPSGDPIRNSESRLAPGVDVRGEGGMVIAPPSRKPDGSVYRWADGCDPWSVPVTEAPEWLLDAIRALSPIAMPRPTRAPDPKALPEVRELLSHIDPDANGYDDWRACLAAIHQVSEGSDDGLALAHEWSARGPMYDAAEVDSKWRSFRVRPDGNGMGTIAAAAQRAGADVAEIGQRHRLAAMVPGSYRPAGMSVTMPRPDAPVDPVDALLTILQPDPHGNLRQVAEEAAHLGRTDREILITQAKQYGVGTALRSAIKAILADKKASETSAADLIADANGGPIPNIENVARILSTDAHWKGVFRMNDFDEKIWNMRDERPMNDDDILVVVRWMQSRTFPSVGPQTVADGINAAALSDRFHPVRDYLTGMRWDGVQRLHALFTHYIPCEILDPIEGHADYVMHAGQRFCIGAVARIMEPGCKVDTLPILSGSQGLKKSTAVEVLAGKRWFGEDMPAMTDKDAKDWLRGKWIAEIAELNSMKGAKIEHVKNFLSTKVDSYRKSYGRTTSDVARQSVFCGTNNADAFLSDPTGGRRFWPLTVIRPVLLDALAADRDQLWAEAVVLYQQGYRWWFDQGEMPALEYMQESVREIDIDEENVRKFLRSVPEHTSAKEVAERALSAQDGDTKVSRRVAHYMRACRWAHVKTVNGQRIWGRTNGAEPFEAPKEWSGKVLPMTLKPPVMMPKP